MFDNSKFGYVVVTIDKKDYCLNTLVEDLLDWEYRLGRVDSEESISFKGLLPVKGIMNLRLLKDASPYGRGYEITVDDYDIYDSRLNRRFGVVF